MQNLNKAEKLSRIFSGEIEFIYGSNKAGDLPNQSLPEIAFIGKSNVGKSSLINAVTSRKALARVSNTPGRTRQINFFRVQDIFNLVDLPGYGFAKANAEHHAGWESTILYYLKNRKTLKLVLVLIDSRRGIKENDLKVIHLLEDLGLNFWIIFTKSDKCTKAFAAEIEASAKSFIREDSSKVIFTNNRDNNGTIELRHHIMDFLASLNNS